MTDIIEFPNQTLKLKPSTNVAISACSCKGYLTILRPDNKVECAHCGTNLSVKHDLDLPSDKLPDPTNAA